MYFFEHDVNSLHRHYFFDPTLDKKWIYADRVKKITSCQSRSANSAIEDLVNKFLLLRRDVARFSSHSRAKIRLPPCIMCVQYRGGCSVPWGVFSTVGDIMSTVGGYLEYRGGVQYRGGIS